MGQSSFIDTEIICAVNPDGGRCATGGLQQVSLGGRVASQGSVRPQVGPLHCIQCAGLL